MKFSIRLLGAAFMATAFGQAFAQIPVIDGTKDASYTMGAVQNTQTGWGDSNAGQVGFANGSEIDNVQYYRTATDLYLFIGGNMENNANAYQKVALFFDTGTGGYNRLPAGLPDIDFNRLQRFGDDGSGNGLTFDAGFNASRYIGLVCGGDPTAVYFNYSDVETITNGGTSNFVGGGGAGTDGTLSGGNNPLGALLTINNSNIAGVTGGTGTDNGNGATVNTGYEVKIPLAMIGNPTGPIRLCTFLFNDGYDFLSNQFIGGIGGGDNLGEPRVVNLSLIPGDQFITIPASTSTETLAPTSFSVGTSKQQSGNLASLAADDNNALVVCKFLVPNQQDIIKCTFNFTTTKSTPSAVQLVSKAKMVAGGVFQYRAFQHNFAGNVDDQLGADVAITAAYNTFTNNASGTLTNYVGAANAMQSKILIRQTGPSVAAVPCVSYEFVNLKVTG